MPRGRKPRPTHLKVLDGNPGGRRLNDREPQPTPELLACPADLDGEAKREWERIAPELHRAGLLTRLDRAGLACYCRQWARWVQAEEMLRRHGAVVRSPNNYPIQSPYLAVANKAMAMLTTMLSEFGMTPAARTRIRVDEGGRAGDLDAFRYELAGRE